MSTYSRPVLSGPRARLRFWQLRFRVWRGRYRVHRYTGIPMRELVNLQRDIDAEIERRMLLGDFDA